MKLSALEKLPAYFDRYILMNDDVTVLESLQQSKHELQHAPVTVWQQLGDKIYAPGKWTVNDVLQHLIDTERVFAYRALSFARGEQTVASFDENGYARSAFANRRTIEALWLEAILVRETTIALYKSFDESMLNRSGMGFKGEYSVHDIGYIIGGHQRWHFRILEERYYPLLA